MLSCPKTPDTVGLRKRKSVGATLTHYAFSGSKVIAEYTGNYTVTSPAKEYIYAGSQLVATLSGSTPTYVHPDHLSTRLHTSSTGTVTRTFGHYPFGETWYESSSDKWKFTSYERDSESGLDYAMFRFDSPHLGRFQSPDPLAGTIRNPQSLNRYAYVRNDPANLIDPLGLCVCDQLIETRQGITCGHWDCGGGGGNGKRQPILPPDDPTEGYVPGKHDCIPRSQLGVGDRAVLDALSFWAQLSGVTYFIGGSGSRTSTGRGLGGSYGGSVLLTADPNGRQAIVVSVLVQGALGTPGFSAGFEIGAATYQSVQGFGANRRRATCWQLEAFEALLRVGWRVACCSSRHTFQRTRMSRLLAPRTGGACVFHQ